MNRKKAVIALAVALALCFALARAALAMSSDSYNLSWKVVSGGGGLKLAGSESSD